MSDSKIKQVGIIGSGTMGSGIAQLAAASGYKVELIDISQKAVNNGYSKIEKRLPIT